MCSDLNKNRQIWSLINRGELEIFKVDCNGKRDWVVFTIDRECVEHFISPNLAKKSSLDLPPPRISEKSSHQSLSNWKFSVVSHGNDFVARGFVLFGC